VKEDVVKQVKASEANRHFSALMDQVRMTGEPVEVLRYRTPAVVIVTADWFHTVWPTLSKDEDGGA
jgi:prevent-host-death family protein